MEKGIVSYFTIPFSFLYLFEAIQKILKSMKSIN